MSHTGSTGLLAPYTHAPDGLLVLPLGVQEDAWVLSPDVIFHLVCQIAFKVIQCSDLLGDFSQMVAWRGQGERFPEPVWMTHEDAAETLQVGESLCGHELLCAGQGKSHHLGQAQRCRHGPGCLAPIQLVQQGPTACEVIGQATIVNDIEDTRIACLEDRCWHRRHKVELYIQVLPSGVAA
jgi:hypothetical protein